MKPIDMTGSRLKHAVNVALEEVTAVCYKEYNDMISFMILEEYP